MIKFRKFGVKHILAGISLLLIFIFTIAFFSNTTLRLLFKDKIRAHKVNNLELLNKANRLFSGVELDVVFYSNNNSFDVNHPPETSSGLTLNEYFQSQKHFLNSNTGSTLKTSTKLTKRNLPVVWIRSQKYPASATAKLSSNRSGHNR